MVDNWSTGSLANVAEARRSGAGQFHFHQIDVRSPDLAELIGRRRPEVVFHLAAQADVRVSVADPLLDADINVIGSLRVLEAARRERRSQGGVRLQRRDHLRRPGSGRTPGQRVTAAAAAFALRGGQEGGRRLPVRLP